MKKGKPDAAFRAAVSLCLIALISGCGGGGGGEIPPTGKTTITGTVVGPTDQPVVGAKVSWQWWEAKSRSRQSNEALTKDGGVFELEIAARQGQVKLIASKPDIGRAETLPIELNGGTVPLTSPIKLEPRIREDRFDPNTVEINHRIVVKLGDRSSDEIHVSRMIEGDQADLSLVDNVIIARGELTVELLFHFDNIPSPDGIVENWRISAIIEFVRAVDRTKPQITQVIPLEGEQKGIIVIQGEAIDPDGRSESRAISKIFRLQESGEEIVVESTPINISRSEIEAPPSGVAFVSVNEADRELGRDSELDNNKFAINLDTTKIADGSHSLNIVAQDKADNSSEPVSITVEIKNLPDPDPWEAMATDPRQLVAVEEEPKDLGLDTWPPGYPYHGDIDAIAVKNNGKIVGIDNVVFEYPSFETKLAQVFPDGEAVRSEAQEDVAVNQQQETYVCSLLNHRIWHFHPDGTLIQSVSIRLGFFGPELIEVDPQGYVWVQFGGFDGQNRGSSFFACYNRDLTPVKVRNDKGEEVSLVINIPGAELKFAADKALDTLIWYRYNSDIRATQIMRRRISTEEDEIIATFKPSIGIGGIEIHPQYRQVIINAHIVFPESNYYCLVQLGKADGQWSELYRTELSDPRFSYMTRLVKGATPDEFYIYGDAAARFRYW